MAKRGITSVQIILSYGQELGFTYEQLLAESKINQSDLFDTQSQVEDFQELKVLENLLALTGDPFRTGVELGLRYQLTSYGIVGYALLASGTLRKAADVGLRYLSLTYAFSQIQLEEAGDDAMLSFRCDIPGDLGYLVLIRDIWAVSVIQKELFAGLEIPVDLHLQGDKPIGFTDDDLNRLAEPIGGHIRFNQRENAYLGLGAYLDAPLAKANDMTAKICEEQCSQLLQEKQSWQGVSQEVRDCLLREGLHLSMEEVASHLARTSRTLHRQLQDENTTWRTVRDQVRMGLAEELLTQPIQLDEIAERLGYSDGANFSHSFKRCKGVTPSAFRRNLLSGKADKT